jgi:hypothetical protein
VERCSWLLLGVCGQLGFAVACVAGDLSRHGVHRGFPAMLYSLLLLCDKQVHSKGADLFVNTRRTQLVLQGTRPAAPQPALLE